MEWRKRSAKKAGEGYYGLNGEIKENDDNSKAAQPTNDMDQSILRKVLAFVPLILVAVMNNYLITAIPRWYPNGFDFAAIGLSDYSIDVAANASIWAIEIAVIVGIVSAFAYNFKRVIRQVKEGLNKTIGGALLAVMNTGSEYGFGGVIAVLPGFSTISSGISGTFTNPLVNGAVTTSVLAVSQDLLRVEWELR